MTAHTKAFTPLPSHRVNSQWTIEEADAALRAEAELIKRTAKPMKGWPLSEIEREYQFYQNDREWPES